MSELDNLPTEVYEIKALLMLKKHRQCIDICESLLAGLEDTSDESSTQRLYLSFYLAMAHDDLARQMYDVSKHKIGRLNIAETCYEQALVAANALGVMHADSPKLPREASSIYLLTQTKLPREASRVSLLSRLPRETSSCNLLSGVSSPWNTSPHVRPSRLTEHNRSIKEQISTHINLVREARERAVAAQSKRLAANVSSSPAQTPLPARGSLPPSKSFWLFTPENVKTTEKRQRIEKGKERAWARPRFQPGRYRMLAEQALAEL